MKEKLNPYRPIEVEKPVVNEITLPIDEVEEDALIVNVDGWRIRVYFDKSVTDEAKTKFVGNLKAKYIGDIKDIHSVKFLPIK